MTNQLDRRIVAGIDGSETSARALTWALQTGGESGATVDVVYAWQAPLVVSAVGVPGRPWDLTEFRLHAKKVVDDCIERARAMVPAGHTPATRIEPNPIQGDPTDVLLEAARGADVLVVGSRGLGGFKGLLLGSVSSRCLHRAPCPVTIVPPDWDPTTVKGTIVVGADGSASSDAAVKLAARIADLHGARLVAVHSWFVPTAVGYPVIYTAEELQTIAAAAKDAAAAMVADVKLADGSAPVVRTVEGLATPTLLEFAADADLLVVGSRGHGSVVSLLIGSVSMQCAQHSPCPVMVVRDGNG